MKLQLYKLISPSSESFAISKQTMLIGSAVNADLCFPQNTISHYHALLTIDATGNIIIQDLNSLNGTFVNGNRIMHATALMDGDTLTIADQHFSLINTQELIVLENPDQNLQSIVRERKIPVPAKVNENAIYIDDEYCDIIFDESDFKIIERNPIKDIEFNSNDYISPEEMHAAFDILKEKTGPCLQVTTLISGNILEQYYLPLQDATYFASHVAHKNTLQIEILGKAEKYNFITIQGRDVQIHNLPEFNINQSHLKTDDFNSTIHLYKGTYQIIVEMNHVPNQLINPPQYIREKDFFKQSSQIFASIMLPMLLLLFVDLKKDEEQPVRELSIIYKEPVKSETENKEVASTNPNNEKQNDGHKQTKQPNKKVAQNKTGAKAPEQAVAAATQAPPVEVQEVVKAKAPVKAYQFQMESNLNNMFQNEPNVKMAQNRAPASNSPSAIAGDLNTKVTGTASAAVGNMGSDLAGTQNSFGSQGLSAKKGSDTSFIQTKTVVLGSMDPELLRQILQQYLPQFRHCYQQELSHNSEDIKGIVDLNFVIDGAGKVAQVDIKAKDNRFSKNGINCMGKVLAIIDFPKPKGGGKVAVRQPLNFFSEKERS
jgi:pSer/pThr/pTyr-binding forkhead associated (FHA) protein